MGIRSKIPDVGKQLVSYKGSELIDRIGEAAVKEVVTNVLCGDNIRSLTENLTRKRLGLSNASMLVTYIRAADAINNFSNNLSTLVEKELFTKKISKEEKAYLNWLVGLTGKSIQNVLRGGKEEFTEYLRDLEHSLQESAEESKKIFGDLTGTIVVEDKKANLSWPVITQLFMAIGAQTLALRGAEKSLYGKLFEKFILGSLLSILDFKFTKEPEKTTGKKIFWLSERGNKRESDATVLIAPGKGVRFDIGFIGPGNTEISLDKVSRFETEMELGTQKHYMSTLVIVDRIGEGSRITEMAQKINGNIIQMSMNFWVRQVAKILHNTTKYHHPILTMSDTESLNFIKDKMQSINLKDFI